MFGIILLLHIFADFNLQIGAGLDKLKQWRWWREQILSEKEAEWEQYKNDYMMALLLHSLEWSLVVCLPLLMCGGRLYLLSAIFHALVHNVIDDLKANWMGINLIQDQVFHAVQVLVIWATWLVFR